MIVLRTPEGLDRPGEVGGHKLEGLLARTPGAARRTSRRTPSNCKLLEDWMRAMQPEEFFDQSGKLIAGAEGSDADRATAAWAPIRTRTAACSEKALRLPDFRDYGIKVEKPGHDRRPRTPARWASSCAT